MYIVFICRKCGHNLYVQKVDDYFDKIASISKKECPNCGEEGYENWVLQGKKRSFPKQKNG